MEHDAVGSTGLPHKIVQALAEETAARLATAQLITHPGEKGAAREAMLTEFVRAVTPLGFEVSTGFIVD